jgi:hypothetical protein
MLSSPILLSLQAVAADFVQLADARQQLAVEHDSLEGAAGDLPRQLHWQWHHLPPSLDDACYHPCRVLLSDGVSYGLSMTVCLISIGDARQDDAAVQLSAAKGTVARRSSRRKAGGRSMVPEAAGGATAGGSSVHSGSKRSGSQAAGAQLDDDSGFISRKRVRRAPAKLLEAPAAATAAAQPRRQPALGDQPQGVTHQRSQEALPDAATAAHSKVPGRCVQRQPRGRRTQPSPPPAGGSSAGDRCDTGDAAAAQIWSKAGSEG